MKIALAYNEILPATRYGGVQRVVMNLAKWYERMGHTVFILGKKGSQITDFENGLFPETWTDLWDHVPSDTDFLHVHEPVRQKLRKPHLISIHGNASPGESFPPNTNFVSRSHARNHQAKYFVLQGIDVERFPVETSKDDYYVFMAKTKWRAKNLKTAIDFANDVKIPLKVMGGTGRDTRYVQYLGLLGDHEGRLDILAKARALLYPVNWDEPCALAPLEALACGTPVLGSANGSLPEEVLPGCGFVTNRYPEFVAAHQKLDLIDPRVCRATIEKEFSAERQARDYLRLIERILQVGELDHSPRHAHDPASVEYLFKPTRLNRLRFQLLHKI